MLIAFLRRTLVVLVGLAAGIGGVGAATATALPPAAVIAADPDDRCSCGAPAVDIGICAACIDVPNPVHEPCGNRHMDPYPGGRCPTP